jgi:ppGpp synthetase/RelA/SpoT-type nucleotidyltranferase
MKKNGVTGVPASPADVRAFVNDCRSRFENDLKQVRSVLDDLHQTDPRLRTIYKIYSRGNHPGADELKSARKIRLKFNEWNGAKGHSEASLFDVPDIVGLTIVVSYPSGIDSVASAIDDAIDRRLLTAVAMGSSDPASTISTKHGRGINSKGYSACHYNLKIPGAGKRPIVELQIKTLLHDAWGAKTHDLTYKPSGKIGEELLESFDLLGANLAILDRQSDALKTSIVRSSEVRERKRTTIQVALLTAMAEGAVTKVAEPESRKTLEALQASIMAMTPDSRPGDCYVTYTQLCEIFQENAGPPGTGVASSTLLSLLAAKTQRAGDFDHAQDILDFRIDAEPDYQEKLKIRLDGVLTAYAAGDVPEAIDLIEEIAKDIEATGAAESAVVDSKLFLRQRISIYSNLAYFHADLVGSHEGDKRESGKVALDSFPLRLKHSRYF